MTHKKTVFLVLVALLVGSFLMPVTAQESSRRQQAQAELEKARELMRQDYFESAVVSYQKAFEIDPTFVDAYAELGKIMLDRQNFAYAIQLYDKLAELEPNNAEWQRVLFDLNIAYEANPAALRAGENLIKMNEAEAERLQKMAELYKADNQYLDAARVLELYATKTSVDANFWDELGQLYAQEGRYEKAAAAYDKALSMEPSNRRYQVGKGLNLIEQNRLEEAEQYFKDLLAEDPDDAGLKSNIARVYALQGDRYLRTNRYNTASEYYTQAEEMSGGDLELDPDRQVVPQLNNRLTTLGRSLKERKELAEELLDPYLLSETNIGTFDVNNYFSTINTFVVPVEGTELSVLARADYYDVSSFKGNGDLSIGYAGLRYNIDRTWSVSGLYGTEGYYDFAVDAQSDNFNGGLRLFRNMWTLTPLAIANDLRYTNIGGFFDWGFAERWSFEGQVDVQNFDDGSTQTIYGLGPSYLLINDPERRFTAINYRFSQQTNDQTFDPLLRFSPRDLSANTLGVTHSELFNDNLRGRIGYFYTWTNNNQGDGSTFLLGADWRLNQSSYLGLEYTLGNFAGGQTGGLINPLQAQNVTDQTNYNVRMDLRVGF